VLARRYTNAEGKDAAWIDVASGAEGHVNLARVFHNDGMVCAYAFAEIESPAEADARLLCGSDDELAVWLNGVKVHDSGVVSRSFEADREEAKIHFAAGRNALLVKVGNQSGPWEFSVRIPGLEGNKFAPAKELAPDEKQRAFALATKPDGAWLNTGDAKRGEKLFYDKEAALGGICATCHAVRGKGGAIGPDLSAIAVNYRRPELAVSILEPSKTIALGFEQSIVETKAGETLVGALRQETNETLTLVGADGQPHVVKKADVKSRKPLELSLMPPGLTLALKPADFADLLAFLETLK
jgi:putative heme-binding domain-containing protein